MGFIGRFFIYIKYFCPLRSFWSYSVHFQFFRLSTTLYLKTVGHRANGPKFATHSQVLSVYTVLLSNMFFCGHLVHFQFCWFYTFNRVSGKWLVAEWNGQNLGLWHRVISVYRVPLTHKCSTRSKVIQCIPIFKRLVIEWNWAKFGHQGYSVYRILLTVKCSRSFRGHSMHFWFSTTL